MRYRHPAYVAAALACLFPLFHMPAHAWNRSTATTFATLPEGSAHPEGMTTDSKGNFYVTTWDYDHPGHLGHLIIFSPEGKFLRRIEIAGSSNRLCEIRFHPETVDLLVNDFGGKQVLKVDPLTGASSVFINIPGEKIGPNAPRTATGTPFLARMGSRSTVARPSCSWEIRETTRLSGCRLRTAKRANPRFS